MSIDTRFKQITSSPDWQSFIDRFIPGYIMTTTAIELYVEELAGHGTLTEEETEAILDPIIDRKPWQQILLLDIQDEYFPADGTFIDDPLALSLAGVLLSSMLRYAMLKAREQHMKSLRSEP